MKQSSKHWYDKLPSFLHSINFTHSNTNNSIFVRKIENSFISLLIYVDDILIARNNAKHIDIVKTSLDVTFKIKYLGFFEVLPRTRDASTT